MRFIVPTHREFFAEWARQRVPGIESWGDTYQTLGLIDEEGRTLAVVLYTEYSRFNVCMHIATEGKQWMTRAYLRAVFDYPFNQLKVDRVTAFVASQNFRSRKFVEHIGFKREGVLREAHHRDDLIAYGMLKRECRWIEHGKAIRARCA